VRHLFDASLLAEFKSQLSGYEFSESVDPDDEEVIVYTFTNATNTITITVNNNYAYFSKMKNDDLSYEGAEEEAMDTIMVEEAYEGDIPEAAAI
jgi:hypothetical protein